MPMCKTGVVIIDSSCLKYFRDANVIKHVLKNMRTVDLQIRMSAINVLEAMKTQNPTKRQSLLKIIRNISEGRPFLPWPFDIIKLSGQTHARGKKCFFAGDSGLEQTVYNDSITEQDFNIAENRMNSLENSFTRMNDEARQMLSEFRRKNISQDHWNTAEAFLDGVWKSNFSYYIRVIWKSINLPGDAPIAAILEDEIWRIFLDINGFAAFERAILREQPRRVHYPDLLQLIYVANSSRRIVVSADNGFLRAARSILHRYPNVRVEKYSDFVAM